MNPVDIIVLAIVVVVGISIGIPLINLVVNDLPYDVERSETISRLTTSAIAIISLYVGARLNGKE